MVQQAMYAPRCQHGAVCQAASNRELQAYMERTRMREMEHAGPKPAAGDLGPARTSSAFQARAIGQGMLLTSPTLPPQQNAAKQSRSTSARRPAWRRGPSCP